MKKTLALILLFFVVVNLCIVFSSFADELPVSFGMSVEQVKTILGEPQDGFEDVTKNKISRIVLSFCPVKYDKFDNALLFCSFYDGFLLEASYIFTDCKNVSNDMKHFRKILESKYGKECQADEAKKCVSLMEIIGPFNQIGYSEPNIWKGNNIFVVLRSENTIKAIHLTFIVDLISLSKMIKGL